ncbi:hypothetical protein [Demequina sediminicola]|uniref:hypothetical protein n=1 Tax=Demequina sediminicola TaxID=1095026 RepID=UPI0007844692|nr:hypothetical protein [Demequina sediminicola]
MAIVSDRVRERIHEDFGASSSRMVSALERLHIEGHTDADRLHAAVVIASRGHAQMFDDALEHAASDWRDLLDRAGLADSEWEHQVRETFGPA